MKATKKIVEKQVVVKEEEITLTLTRAQAEHILRLTGAIYGGGVYGPPAPLGIDPSCLESKTLAKYMDPSTNNVKDIRETTTKLYGALIDVVQAG